MPTLEPRQVLFAAILLVANRMQATYDARLGEVTLKQWLALAVVHNLPQPVPSTAVIASILGTSHQNVSKLLAALAAKDFITLTPSPGDRRANQVALTPEADAWLARHADHGETMLDELFAGVAPDDLAAALRVLDAMGRALTGESVLPEER